MRSSKAAELLDGGGGGDVFDPGPCHGRFDSPASPRTTTAGYHDQRSTTSPADAYAHTYLPPSVRGHLNASQSDSHNASSIPSTRANDQEALSIRIFNNVDLSQGTQGLGPTHGNPSAERHSAPASYTYLNREYNIPPASLSRSAPSYLGLDVSYNGDDTYALSTTNDPDFWQESFRDYGDLMAATVGIFPEETLELSSEVSPGSRSSPASNTSVFCSICGKVFRGEYARGNLTRHRKTCHSSTIFPCEVGGCRRQYHRSDARLHHYRKSHPELNMLPAVARRSN
ncbi:hypothetical protein CC80DRAFT_189899 [Byssothecium circinans]|uniref:C2H2-type domain-containing protein n=1 Tax=Byssothecium circinans TaxID=147558 RepID=A0A6A5THS8_9PLEO|nr:hypothetical protein CC80DRAFT_189899 [Byssothecium circinans]